MKCSAPAKLNLYLHVLGRRPDGYHQLDSLVVFAESCDFVEVRAGSDLALAVEGQFVADLAELDPEDNLVIRAARRLARLGGVNPDVSIRLDKRLPVAAGIGGGSADAAAALHALNEFWHLRVPEAELAVLGMELGADVPACLRGRTLYLGGAGEEIDPGPVLPSLPLVLVGPGASLGTAEVFRAFDGAWSNPARLDGSPADLDALAQELASRSNDLQIAAQQLEPAIVDALDALSLCPGCLLARMSGSGPVCFGIFESRATADAAAGRIAAKRSGWWVSATETIAAEAAVSA